MAEGTVGVEADPRKSEIERKKNWFMVGSLPLRHKRTSEKFNLEGEVSPFVPRGGAGKKDANLLKTTEREGNP